MPELLQDLLLTGASVEISAAAKRPTINVLAYSGGLMNVPGWGPIVIDLSGLDLSSPQVSLLADHDASLNGIVGHGDTVPHFGDPLNMGALRRFLEADGIEVVIIDPVYLCLPCDINPANLFDIGRLLQSVSDVCKEVGATPILVHHLKKGVASP